MEDFFTEEKGANQLWKESGTTLDFKSWLDREKAKGTFIPNKIVADTTASIKSNIKNQLGIYDANSSNNNTNTSNPNTILGLNKWILAGSAIIIIGAISYSIYNKYKK